MIKPGKGVRCQYLLDFRCQVSGVSIVKMSGVSMEKEKTLTLKPEAKTGMQNLKGGGRYI
jgi:hypothetical protein